jgi:hypothetical protein
MATKRDFNEVIDRSIQDAERCIADLKRLKAGRVTARPIIFVLDLVQQGEAFVRDLNRVFGILFPPPPVEEPPFDADGDRHVAIRNRTKRIESKQLALPPAPKKQAAGLFE